MLKGWLVGGVALAIAGSLLMWNGIQQRFTLEADAAAKPAPPAEVVPVTATAAPNAETPAFTNKENPAANPGPEAVDAGMHRADPPAATTGVLIEPQGDETGAEPHSLPFIADRRKSEVLEYLREKGWKTNELELLHRYLTDPRAEFRPEVLQVNINHTETEQQYAQHLTSRAVDWCMDFWINEGDKVVAAAANSGIPPEIVTAIMKIETNFGTYPGKEYIFNVYWSLSLGDKPEIRDELLPRDDPDRSAKWMKMKSRAGWARRQLRDLLYMATEGHGRDPLSIRGSWAGAFGLAQFVPASYRSYGRDGNGDGVVDLDDVADAAASISYYLKENGWRGEPSMKRRRKVIMRYNHSPHYADAVLALADSLSGRWVGLRQQP